MDTLTLQSSITQSSVTQTALLRKMAAVALLGMRERFDDEARAAMRPVITAANDSEMLEVFMAFAAAVGGRAELARELLAVREATVEQGVLDAVLALGLSCAGDVSGGMVLQRLLSLVDDTPTRDFVLKVSSAMEALA
jgi:hypothetical protein